MRKHPGMHPRTLVFVVLVYFGCYGLLFPPHLAPQVWGQDGGQVFTQPQAGANQAATPEQLAQMIARRLSDAMELARRSRDLLPRETYAPTAFAEQLGREHAGDRDALIAAAFTFVRDHTDWIAYHGRLRGATGVMMDRLGNSLDRSLLLAHLLQTSGLEVRLAQRRLGDDQARLLAETLRPARVRTSAELGGLAEEQRKARIAAGVPLRNHAEASQEARRALQRAGLGDQEVGQRMEAAGQEAQLAAEEAIGRIIAQAQLLNDTIATKRPMQDNQGETGLAAVADHWWVQVNLGDQEWRDLDPSQPRSEIGQVLGAPERTIAVDELPVELSHVVRLSVIVERHDGAQLVETQVLEYDLRPADLFGKRITLGIAPEGDDPVKPSIADIEDPLAAWDAYAKAMSQRRRWAPLVQVEGDIVVQRGFDAAGMVIEKPRLAAPPAIAGKFQEAIGGIGEALGGSPPDAADEATSLLSGVWLEVESVGPDASGAAVSQGRERREIYDLLGTSNRLDDAIQPLPDLDRIARLHRSARLTWISQLLPLGCRFSPLAAEELKLVWLQEQRRPLLEITQGRVSREPSSESLQRSLAAPPIPAALYAWAIARHAWNPAEDRLAYTQPNLIAQHITLLPTDRETFMSEVATGELPHDAQSRLPEGLLRSVAGLDILLNSQGALPGAPDSFERSVRQGVADTVTEAVIAGSISDAEASDNTSVMFAGAEPNNRWSVLVSDADLGRLTPQRRAELSRFAGGKMLVLPPIVEGGATPTGFWQVDLRTGTTIGYNSMRWGGSPISTYIVNLALGIAVAGFAVAITCIIHTRIKYALTGDAGAAQREHAECMDKMACGAIIAAVVMGVAIAYVFWGSAAIAAGVAFAEGGSLLALAIGAAIGAAVTETCEWLAGL